MTREQIGGNLWTRDRWGGGASRIAHEESDAAVAEAPGGSAPSSMDHVFDVVAITTLAQHGHGLRHDVDHCCLTLTIGTKVGNLLKSPGEGVSSMAADEGCRVRFHYTLGGSHYKVLSIGRTSPTGDDPHRYPLAKEKSQHPKKSEDFQECG